VPAEAVLRVKKGQRVKGGASVLAEMPESEMAVGAATVRRTLRASVSPYDPAGDRA